MSTLSNSKGKDAGKKYTSLNINQTYKGSKGESKSTTGQTSRQHGLQSLGKIQSRRAPVPANLPSLKRENSGNDPRVNLVPSGSQGWVKKENTAQSGKQESRPEKGTSQDVDIKNQLPQAKVKPGEKKEISLRPNAGVVPPQPKAPSDIPENQENGKASWGNKSQQPQPQSGQPTYFSKEFPKLGGKGGEGGMEKSGDPSQGNNQGVNPQDMDHQNYTSGQKWKEQYSGPVPVPSNFPQFHGERPAMYNGNQQNYPYYMYPPGQGGRGMPMPPFPYPFPYPSGGKMPPFDPRFFARMPKPYTGGSASGTERPSVVKDSDLHSLDVEGEKDDASWAGAQEEVDYNAKLKFDESDDSDDENRAKKNGEYKKGSSANSEEKARKRHEEWAEAMRVNYQAQMQQMANSQQNWHGMPPFPGYDPQRGPPPHGYPIHPMYFMYGFSQNMPQPSQAKDEPNKVNNDNRSREAKPGRPEDKKEIERKAAAQAKLRDLEEKMKRRTAEEQQQLEKAERVKRHDSRSRNDSEASDSSRKEVPPRFRRQSSGQSSQSTAPKPSDTTEKSLSSESFQISQREDTITSDVDSFIPRTTTKDGNSAAEQKQLYQETAKSERVKRASSSSDHFDKDKVTRHGSTSSTSSKDGDKTDGVQSQSGKKELKDLSQKNMRTEKVNLEKTSHDRKKKESDDASRFADGKALTVNSERFHELKLTKGQVKNDKSQEKQDENVRLHPKTSIEKKAVSPWSRVVAGEKDSPKDQSKKSLVDIQKEEEQKERNKQQTEIDIKPVSGAQNVTDRESPTENQFRSDYYQKKGNQRGEEDRQRTRLEQRGRFNNDRNNDRRRSDREPRTKRDDNYNRDKYGNRSRGDYHKESRRDDNSYRDTRRDRDDYRKAKSDDKDDQIKEDKNSSSKEEISGKSKTQEVSIENVSDSVSKKSGKDEDYKRERRDDKRDNRRRDEKRERRGDDQRNRRDDKGYDKDYDRRRDARHSSKYDTRKESHSTRKDLNRTDKDVGRKHEKREDSYETRSKRNEWNNKDYRQSAEYQKEIKEKENKLDDIKEKEKAKAEPSEVNEPKEAPAPEEESKENKSAAKTEDLKLEETHEKESNVDESQKEKTEHKESGGFGTPNAPKEFKSRDNYDDSHPSRGRGSSRGRGRGRGSTRGGRSNEYQSRRGKDRNEGMYEDISPGEFSDGDHNTRSSSRSKSVSNKEKKMDWEMKAPRFQNKQDEYSRGRGRGRGVNGRGRGGNRGRGERERDFRADTSRGRGSRSRGTHSSSGDQRRKYNEDGKDENSKDFASESPVFDADGGAEYVERNERNRERGRGRGRGSSDRGRGSNRPFLAKRQQVEKRLTSVDKKEASSVADKHAIKSNEVQPSNSLYLEDIPAHSPTKKVKPYEKKEEKKRDITREFDLSNIRGVVCIDDFDVSHDQKSSTSEDDGFVTVTSKKQQKEMRDRQREEDKRKLLLEQKKEKEMITKKEKNAKKDQKHASSVSKSKPTVFVDAPMSNAQVEKISAASIPVTSTVTMPISPAPPPASNAAMAAFGVWEPAQMLSGDAAKYVMSTSSSSVNAWQRPLTLTASLDSDLPDPRAVGTGKPSSSHPGLMSKSTLVPTQPTPEAASSPLVTPPALGPIGTSTLNTVSNGIPADLEVQVKQVEKQVEAKEKKETSVKKSDRSKGETINKERKRIDRLEGSQRHERSDRKEKEKDVKKKETTSKRMPREKPPRFQSSSLRKDGEERSRSYDENRKSSRQSTDKPRKKPDEKQRKGENVKQQISRTTRTRPTESIHDVEDSVFTNEVIPEKEQQAPRKSKLSDADKVVGANKPSLKSQNSIGSYNGEISQEEVIEPVKMPEAYKKPKQPSFEEEERNAKDTARSVIKSLNDDEERSLETRSLPGTPPLAVKIPEPPSMSGPSSDPGRGPSPSVAKGLGSSIAQEMSDLNRRLLSAKKAWDDIPTSVSWSESTVTSNTSTVSTSSVSAQSSIDKTSDPSSPTKTEPLSSSSSISVKKPEEVTTVSSFTTKRSEQQVCKVKPQQQIHQDEIKDYQMNGHQTNAIQNRDQLSTVTTSKYASYVLPMDRQVQQQRAMYTSDGNYSEQLRAQASTGLSFQNLNQQVRSVNPSVSPLSHQRDLMLSSFPVGYGTATPLQASQSQLLAWQVVSNANVQHAKTMAGYENPNQASLFTSSASQLIMPYGSNFSTQRNAPNIQRQPVGVVPMQQQQAPVGMMQQSNQNHVRRSPRYQGFPDQSHLANPNQMPMMLDPNAAANMQQMTPKQRSDLVKHVHAKPFEPTSQTPPLVQSPPIVHPNVQSNVQSMHRNQHHQTQRQSQQHQPPAMIPSVFNKPSSAPSQTQFVQNMTRYTRPPLMQHPNVQSVQPIPQNPLVASVRPQTIQGRVLSNSNQSSGVDRSNNLNAFDPNLAMVNGGTTKNQAATMNSNLQMQFNTHQHNQYHQANPQQQYHGNNAFSMKGASQRVGPGPIQRPGAQSHPQPLISQPPNSFSSSTSSSRTSAKPEIDFKKIQRQKMLEDTKRYFSEDTRQQPPGKQVIKEEKPAEKTPVVNPELSKHDKYILPDTSSKDKKFDKKTRDKKMRNRGGRVGGGGNVKAKNASIPQKKTGDNKKTSGTV